MNTKNKKSTIAKVQEVLEDPKVPEVLEVQVGEPPTPKNLTTFTFTIQKTVQVEVQTAEEQDLVMAFWTSKEQSILALSTKKEMEILRVWGGEGSRKAILKGQDGVIHKYWFYTKWGWGEA